MEVREEARPRILAIPREEEGNPSLAAEAKDEDKDERVEELPNQPPKDERPHLDQTVGSRMVLRSQTKTMSKNGVNSVAAYDD